MRTLRFPAIVLLCFCFSLAQSQVQPEVEITAEPSHHLVLENRYVRVFQVEVAPHAATLMHRHRHDYMFVTLGESDVSNEVEGKNPVALKLQDGDTRFLHGNFAHIARNLANNPFRNITIEFLRDETERNSTTTWDEDRGLHVLHGGTEEILFAQDGARASEVELQTAGVDDSRQTARPDLLVAITNLVVRGDFGGKGSSNLQMKSGDVKWFAHGLTRSLTNVGEQKAKYVVVEFQ
jgi:quercetin dioxygenase-like cupin family protein